LALLIEEMNIIMQMENYASLVCEAMECCIRDRSKGSTQPKIVEEKFFANFCRTVKLTLQQQIAIGVALTQSDVNSVSNIGVRHLRAKLPELESVTAKEVPVETMIVLLNLFRMNAELNQDTSSLLAVMERNYPDVTLNCTPAAGMNLLANKEPPAPFNCEVDVASLILDLGYSTTYSVAVLGAILSEAMPIQPNTAARLLFAFSTTLDSADCELSPVLVNTMLPDNVTPVPDSESDSQNVQTKWNLDVVCEFLAPFKLDSNQVVQHFDQHDLKIKNEASFTAFVQLFARLFGKHVPVTCLIDKMWRNMDSQLLFLEFAEASDAFSFSTSPCGPLPLAEGFSDLSSPPLSDAWLNPNFFRFLLLVGDTSYAQRASEMFERGSRSCPEVLAMVLALHTTEPAYSSTRLHASLTKQLLVPFFLPNSVPGPHVALFLRRLWALNMDVFLRCCRYAYGMQPNTIVIQHLVTLTASLSNGGEPLMEMPGHELMLAVACTHADQNKLDLDAWLSEQVPRKTSVQVLLSFVKRHEEGVLHRAMRNDTTSPLTIESLTSILKILEKVSPSAQELAPLIESCLTRCLQLHPTLKPIIKPAVQPSQQRIGNTQAPTNDATTTGGAVSGSGRPAGGSSDEIEDMANSYFQKIYTSEQSISEVIEMLKRFKTSENQRENEIFACMIHNLFDEYRFFHKYPEKELRITGILFGTLIQHQLVSNMTLGIALRYVLEALRKPSWQSGKMFRFGMFALEQFKSRLGEWPQYCSHVVQIEYLNQHHAELVDEVKRAMNSAKTSEAASSSNIGIDKAYESDASFMPVAGNEGGGGILQPRPAQSTPVPKSSQSSLELPPAPSVMMHGMDGSTTTRVEDSADKLPPTPPTAQVETGPAMTPHDRALIMEMIMPAGADPLNPTNPPESVAERIHLIVNNISMQNLDQKIVETRNVLEAEHLCWFGNYLVVKRISTQPNFHQLYMAFLVKLDAPELFNAVLTSVFHNVSKLLFSAKITTSTSERSLLKNLGSFLGQMTLARNRPILQRKLDVKELLCQGYETGRLIAVTPFVAKIMEGGKDCRVFRPPNPWTMSLMGVLRELYDLDDLKMNIKFEIEVLCKHLGLKIDDVTPQRILCLRLQPRKDKTPDFNVRPSAVSSTTPDTTPQSANTTPTTPFSSTGAIPPTSSTPEPVSGEAGSSGSTAPSTEGSGDQTVIPNLGAYVTVSPQLVIFQQHAHLKSTVSVAVDRAIREIIQPVVERSVTIACITTKELVVKDFALEPNEQKMRKAAQLMVANLAGSLAVVTCKEPLRLSMANHLRTMLQQAPGVEPIALEHAVQTCSTDNLELGCMLIEKAATEAAIRDMDESLAGPLAERRAAAAQGQTENTGKRYPAALPEMLRPSRQGLTPQQITVYDAFTRHPRHPPMSGSAARPEESGQAALDAQQAVATYTRLIGNLETAIGGVSKLASGRHVTLTMLEPEHEVTLITRQILEVAPKIAQQEREAATYQFARSVFFKKIMEADELLKLETFVTILGGLKDECKTLCKDIMGWISYLPVNDDMDCKLHRATLILLMRAKVCRIQELDMHIAVKMNGGAALVWVEFAMLFVRQCVVERVGLWSDFGNIFDMLGKAAQRHGQARKVNKFMEELRVVAQQTPQKQLLNAGEGGGGGGTEAPGARDQVTHLLERWIRVWNESGGAEQKCAQFITLLHQQNILKTEEMTDTFLRISIELCVDACVKTATPSETPQADGSATPTTTFGYKVMDALSHMLVILVKYGSAEPQSVNSRVHFLNRILATLNRVLINDANDATTNQGSRRPFEQRPYFRVMINLLRDLNTTDPVVEQNNIQILSAFATAFQNIQPAVVPAFAFSWLELISHRSFMPALLLAKPAQKGWVLMHRILIDLFVFMEPFLRRSQLLASIRKLYKGTLRVLLVLLHDFPEFLSDYHFSFCDVIPPNCIQLRNLFLSAFPRAMRLPDPFTPNLKVDQLPEIAQPPRILSNIVAAISSNGLRQDLDNYLKNQQPKSFLEWLPDRLRNGDSSPGAPYNVPAINSLVVYVGSQGIKLLQSKNLTHSPVMEIFQALMSKFDAEGRYYLLNAIANQLRYPNSHTHYFSCVLLFLFAETKSEVAKEQITRVLLERLIVHRPHPWGLLITFIELIKNARYNFWAHNFTHCSPEIEKVFESVARSCMGPGHTGITTASSSSQAADQAAAAPTNTTP
jgi:CCR4-NOT transcription complex subunit 1